MNDLYTIKDYYFCRCGEMPLPTLRPVAERLSAAHAREANRERKEARAAMIFHNQRFAERIRGRVRWHLRQARRIRHGIV